jgi:nondiscriminating aspartyl-tRNA synthetase
MESAIEILGAVVANPHAPGGHELVDASVRIVAAARQPPPLDLFRPEISAQLPTILDHAAVSLRHARSREALRIAARSVEAFRSGLSDRGFVEIFTQKIVTTSTESGASVFPVEYFGRKAYLAQSPQLYKQMMVGVFERVFEVGPVFRAEPHDTTRHLTEYVSLDAEMGFIDDERDVVQVLSDVIEDMVAAVGEDERAIRIAGATLPRVPDLFPVLHLSDAQASIGEATGEDLSDQDDLAPAHERWLGEWAVRERGSEFLVVTGYPMRKRPFYTHPDPDRPGFSRGFDLLFRGWRS